MDSRLPKNTERYSLSLRTLHWIRAALIFALILMGLAMVRMPEDLSAKFDLYPIHKEFGILVFLIAAVQITIRARQKLPGPPAGLAPWERVLSKAAHHLLYVLVLLVPLMGYAMSSTFTESDGVPFFFTELPELLPKNDAWFAAFQWLHRTLAYTLLALVALHVVGALKHRFLDKNPANDVLRRMT